MCRNRKECQHGRDTVPLETDTAGPVLTLIDKPQRIFLPVSTGDWTAMIFPSTPPHFQCQIAEMSRLTPVAVKKRKAEESTRSQTSNSRTSKPRKRIKKQQEYHSSSEDSDVDDDGEEVGDGFNPVSLADSENEDVHPSRVTRARRMDGEGKKKTTRVTARDAPVDEVMPAAITAPDAAAAVAVPKIVKAKRVKPQMPIPASKVEEGLQDDASDDVEEEEVVSSSEDESARVDANVLAKSVASRHEERDSTSDDSDSGSDSDSNSGTDNNAPGRTKSKSKRNDPTAFSTSISKILSTKLPTSKRDDPVLSRSREAAQTAAAATESRLDRKAQARLRAEKYAAYTKGRVTDVLGIERGVAGQVAEEEKALRKIAQRGVIQLFNAFQAAHVRAEQARREERQKGTVGMGRREEKANEDGKAAFLAMIGGKKATTTDSL